MSITFLSTVSNISIRISISFSVSGVIIKMVGNTCVWLLFRDK